MGLRGVPKGGTAIPADRNALTVTPSLPRRRRARHRAQDRPRSYSPADGCSSPGSHPRAACWSYPRSCVQTRHRPRLRPARQVPAWGKCWDGRDWPRFQRRSCWNARRGTVDEDELYTTLDWLRQRQPAIETTLTKRHLSYGTLVLYDVSSSYMEGRCCPLAKRGYSGDGRSGTLQIVYRLLCVPDGCPVAIEVFDDSTADPTTLAKQVETGSPHCADRRSSNR